MSLARVLILALCLTLVPGCATTEPAPPPGENGSTGTDGGSETNGSTAAGNGDAPIAVFETSMGTIRITLRPDAAPQTVQNLGNLAKDGYYDGVRFHRVIDGFMIQGGDPKSKDDARKGEWGSGGPGYSIIDEFLCEDGSITNTLPANCPLALTFDKPGLLAMANTGRAKTGGSQFFITVGETPHLNGRHSIYGEVTEGMDVVYAIAKVETECTRAGQRPGCGADRPTEPVTIKSITIEGDLPGVEVQRY